jgi:hypothetical protein
MLQELVVNATADAPASVPPIEAAVAGFEAAGREFFVPERRPRARQRQAVIDVNPGLQERELAKLASLSAALAGALRQRGVGDPVAGLTAEVAIAVFRTAFERWIGATDESDFPQLVRESRDQLKALTAG